MGRYTLAVQDGLIEDKTDYYLVNCKNFRDPVGPPMGSERPKFVKVGITKRLVAAAMAERNTFMLGAVFGILPVEMPRITSAHLGVMRPMRFEQDDRADGKVFVVVMHPTKDVQAVVNDDNSLDVQEVIPLPRQNFVAILSPNRKPEKFEDVHFWLEYCNWVDCDPIAPQFPVNYMNRYEKACIWTG
ncbi:MAG: hypothetical protein AAFY06_02385 [Pseudomonadota bacterium]